MTVPGQRRCQACGAVLAADNRGKLCSPCSRAASIRRDAPVIPDDLWDRPEVQNALVRRDFGGLLQIVRRASKPALTQADIGRMLDLTQAQVSRIERGITRTNDVEKLERWARALQIPQRCLWFELTADTSDDASHVSAPARVRATVENGSDEDQEDPVHRRQFLALSLASTATGVVGSRPGNALDIPMDVDLIRVATLSYRRLDSTTESGRLREPVASHLVLADSLVERFPAHSPERAAASAASSEIAGFAAWLAADVDDIRSARDHYQRAVRYAQDAGDPLLAAYMQGSMGQFAVEADEPYQGLAVIRSARNLISQPMLHTAAAWLDSLEAVALASTGNPHALKLLDRAERHLDAAEHATDTAWPWVFPFNRAKIAAFRAITAARLGRPSLARDAFTAGAVSSQSPKQRAVALVDHAGAFLAEPEVAGAATLALRALELGERFGSERVRRKVTRLRRQIGDVDCAEMRKLDDRLNDAYT